MTQVFLHHYLAFINQPTKHTRVVSAIKVLITNIMFDYIQFINTMLFPAGFYFFSCYAYFALSNFSTSKKKSTKNQSNIYLFKVNNRNTINKCEVFKVNNENTRMTSLNIFYTIFCCFQLLALNK